MECLNCFGKMNVLEVRDTFIPVLEVAARRRRYFCPACKNRTSTIEIPAEAVIEVHFKWIGKSAKLRRVT